MSSPLAPYACPPSAFRGRLHPEPESRIRTPFQRDRDRIIHSAAFRRLKHKTQVFVYHEGDYYRTRLTHSIEVSQIGRSIARILGLEEDLTETLALAHDLGHTPFGHAGEDALDAEMAEYGGFDHNAQTLRIVTQLENRYAEFDGLNLSWATLEGIVKHNGPLTGPYVDPARAKPLPVAIKEYAKRQDLELHSFASMEAQVAALADDIAYNNHDIDDGLRAGLFTIEDIMAVPMVGPTFQEVMEKYPGIETGRLIHESVRRMIGMMIEDVVTEARHRIAAHKIDSVDAVRALDRAIVSFSPAMTANERAIKAFLRDRMYRHYKVNRAMSKAKRVVADLFKLFIAEPDTLPDEWRQQTDGAHSHKTARVVADYIAGMTDRYALQEHDRLFDLTAGNQ